MLLADARGLLGDLDDIQLARRGGSSMDEPEGVKGREEVASGREAGEPEAEEAGDGFQLVTHGKKKKSASGQEGGGAGSGAVLGAGSVRALTKDKVAAPGTKPKMPFHDPSIPRPQDVYKIIVDNYKPFEHVWLERSEDGTRRVHPLVSALFRPLVALFLATLLSFGVFNRIGGDIRYELFDQFVRHGLSKKCFILLCLLSLTLDQTPVESITTAPV